MKLCKDCKHYVPPSNVLAHFVAGAPVYTHAMCSHPDGRRGVVDGRFETACAEARSVFADQGEPWISAAICGADANLFEERRPTIEPEQARPGSIQRIDLPQENGRKRWFFVLFGG